jgi:hypothetical protein
MLRRVLEGRQVQTNKQDALPRDRNGLRHNLKCPLGIIIAAEEESKDFKRTLRLREQAPGPWGRRLHHVGR